MGDKPKAQLLFVCTGNTCRSPMAEYAWNANPATTDFTAVSAGLYAFDGEAMSKNSLEVLKENRIEAAAFRSQSVTFDLIKDSCLILTMSAGHRHDLLCRFPDAAERCFTLLDDGDIPDPFGQSIAVYRQTYNEICRGIEKWIKLLTGNN